ncbi:MAG: DUF1566 domain-containing protein [Myxococcales bacterium]|nr:DUF1566 domain-containing protein [Myxococcales bacterium]
MKPVAVVIAAICIVVSAGPLRGDVPVPRFTRTVTAGYPVVVDAATGLVWQGCPAGMTGDAASCSGTASTMSWQAALDYCQDSTLAGFSDWYLPSINELRSIVDNHQASPSIDRTFFPGTPSGMFWSSSSSAGSASNGWCVGFNLGNVSINDKTSTNYVRCVRLGP